MARLSARPLPTPFRLFSEKRQDLRSRHSHYAQSLTIHQSNCDPAKKPGHADGTAKGWESVLELVLANLAASFENRLVALLVERVAGAYP
jgi:hypothetical protein